MRVGKWITFRLEGSDKEEISARVDEMCRRLLANPVIERYRFVISDDESGG
jgi:phosphoribosylformylglycinamidine synthase